jgi:hypothetical protein
MRYLDLVAAALIGMSTIAGIVAWTPGRGDLASRNLMLESELRDGLFALLQQRGIFWLTTSSPYQICAYLHELSNSSVTYSASLGPYQCSPQPPVASINASLTLELVPYRVVLEIWANTPA